VRLFFAIALEEMLRVAAAQVVDRLQQRLSAARSARAVKWVERDNLHVTMRFLGEVDERRAAALVEAAGQPLAQATFDLALGSAGAFPAAGPPRVLWIGLAAGADSARAVFRSLEQRTAALGFEPEPRAYTPHVTLGRVREIDDTRGRDLRKWLAETPPHLGTQRVNMVTLYRSHLSSAGPRYEVVAEVPLS
jgi:2'-5' RNA ligase